MVEAFTVDSKHFKRLACRHQVNDSCTANLGHVPAAAEHAVSDTRRSTTASAQEFCRVFFKSDIQNFRTAHQDALDVVVVVKLQSIMKPESVAQRARQQPASCCRAHQRKMLERQVHAPGRRSGIEHDVEPEVFHGGVEVLLDHAVQTVDFVDKQDIVFL